MNQFSRYLPYKLPVAGILKNWTEYSVQVNKKKFNYFVNALAVILPIVIFALRNLWI